MTDLAKDLLERTTKGQISWRTTDNENNYLYAGSQASIILSSYNDRTRADYNGISLKLLNGRGTVVASVEKAHVADDPWAETRDEEWNKLLEDLLNAARRSALNFDGVLDGLIDDLKEGRSGPSEPDTGFSDEPPF